VGGYHGFLNQDRWRPIDLGTARGADKKNSKKTQLKKTTLKNEYLLRIMTN